jgi:hypothetical protein
VTVAIVVFFTTKVTSPPPELFLANPIAYMARIQNATGVVMAEFLRHSGAPTLFWQRSTRAREGQTLDDLHCLAVHKFRAAHKTSSSQISLLHLISIYCTHPELRTYLRARLFVSPTGRIGAAIGTDRSLETMNAVQKERHIGQSLLQSLSFTLLIQPMQHVYRRWKMAMSTHAAGDDGIRASMVNEVDALVRLFVAQVGIDLETYTQQNSLWYTGNPINMRAAPNLKRGRPWQLIRAVGNGTSSCIKKSGNNASKLETWAQWASRHIRDHMFYM